MTQIADDLLFDIESHTYTEKKSGIIIPGVSQLLQEFGLIDLSNVPPARLEMKRKIGVITHKGSELLDQNNLNTEHFEKTFPEALPYLRAYQRFREIEDFEPIYQEHRLLSKKWRFAGTMDRIGYFRGQLAILDLKCTWGMYPSTGPQMAAYAILAEEHFKVKPKLRIGLQLKSNEAYEIHEFKDKTDHQDFLGCVYMHWQKRNKYKTSKGIPHEHITA